MFPETVICNILRVPIIKGAGLLVNFQARSALKNAKIMGLTL